MVSSIWKSQCDISQWYLVVDWLIVNRDDKVGPVITLEILFQIRLNSLATLKYVILKHTLVINILSYSNEIALMWITNSQISAAFTQQIINTLGLKQNGRHFSAEKCPKCPLNTKPDRLLVWNRQLSERKMTFFNRRIFTSISLGDLCTWFL